MIVTDSYCGIQDSHRGNEPVTKTRSIRESGIPYFYDQYCRRGWVSLVIILDLSVFNLQKTSVCVGKKNVFKEEYDGQN